MKTCPTCHRPFGSSKRICFACGKPIGRHDKWHIVGCYIVHDDCQNPTIRVLVRTPQPVQPLLEGTAAEENEALSATEESPARSLERP